MFKHNAFILIVSLFLIIVVTSCESKPKQVMSQSEMTDFLIELHQLDGTLSAKGLGYAQDSINNAYYMALLKKHGITKSDFDSSLVWYAKNPKKFERIYLKVVSELTSLDEKVKKGYFHPQDSARLRNMHDSIWPLQQRRFAFTKDSIPSKIKFVVKNRPLVHNDMYVLSFLHRVGKSNKAKNQQALIKVHYNNGTRDSIVCKLISDSLTRRYTIRLKATKKQKIDSISGAILNFDAKKGHFNALIDSIKLIRIYNSLEQDSLLREVSNMHKSKLQDKLLQ